MFWLEIPVPKPNLSISTEQKIKLKITLENKKSGNLKKWVMCDMKGKC